MRLSDIGFQEELFYAKILRDPNGCWEWRGRRKSPGKPRKNGGHRARYGQFGVYYTNRPGRNSKGVLDAHRLMWILMNGEVDDRLKVCHTCDNTACVRPDHLFLGTQSDNMQDCVEKGRHAMRSKTHCPNGHEYTEENTYLMLGRDGYRQRRCRECHRSRQRTYAKRKYQAKQSPLKQKKSVMQRLHLTGDNETRFLLKTERTAGGCWTWKTGLNANGYGQFAVKDERFPVGDKRRYKTRRVHIWSYENFVGPVPRGLIVRHLCHNRACVRPEHLEVGTHKENMQDAYDANRLFNQKKTHCQHGHEFTEENTIYDKPGPAGRPKRHCRTCKMARSRRILPWEAEYMFFLDSGLDRSI